ncbi:MAG: type VII secretion protein EccE [Micromonosporaceae bacterium]|nr:type VII secretion protein EccE [Micromonosporaceae bacterium]
MTTAHAGAVSASVPMPPTPTARATAAPKPPLPTTTPAGTPRAIKRPGVIWGVHVTQIVLWQVALALVLASLGRHLAVLIAAAVTAALILLLTAIRIRGRWVYQLIGLRLSYLSRPRALVTGAQADRRSEFLAFVMPGASADSVETDEHEVGVLDHVGGAAAIIELAAESSLVVERAVTLPSPASLLPSHDPDSPPVSLQLLIQAVPAPTLTAVSVPAASSYYALTNGSVPSQRRAWLALQLAHSAGYPSDQIKQAVGNSVRRLVRRLRQEGISARPLDREEALSTMASLAHLNPSTIETSAAVAAAATGATIDIRAVMQRSGAAAQNALTPLAQEHWTVWWSESVAQESFVLKRWPSLDSPAGQQLISQLTSVPSLGTTVSLAARRVPPPALERPSSRQSERRARNDARESHVSDDVAVELTVRIAAPNPQRLASVSSALLERARKCGARLERLDGQQARGIAATLPLGGFLP